MLKSLIAGLSVALILDGAALAQTCTAYPNTLTNGTTADATQVMANFNCAALTGGATFTGPINLSTAVSYPAITITSTGYAGMQFIHTGSETGAIFNDGNFHVEGYGNLWLNGDNNGNIFLAYGGGDVQIGPSSSAPSIPLTVISAGNTATAYVTVLPQNQTESVNIGYNHIWEAGSNGSNALWLDSQGSGGMILQANGGTGNVGIRTTTPATTLSLGTAVTTIKLAVYDNGGSNIYGMGVNSGELTFGAAIAPSGTPQMVLTNAGNVGIGTASPSYTLHVNGTAYATGAAGALSDVRHKDHIAALPDGAVGLVDRLRPVTFVWKHPTDEGMKGEQIGFIAQEVERVFPSVVLTETNAEKTKDLKYTELIPLLTKAIQEQQAEIQALRAEVAALKAHQ